MGSGSCSLRRADRPTGATSPRAVAVLRVVVHEHADGSGLQQFAAAENDRGPQVTRDGVSRIFFVRTLPGNDDSIWVMNADGSGAAQVLNSTGQDLSPAPEPAVTCQGKKATIIGTDAAETLTGGPLADVISAFGGKDQVNALTGNDTACGDDGKDILRGAAGRDVLNGGKGNDKTVGGKGKDKCIGGKGNKDTAKGCEKEKKIP